MSYKIEKGKLWLDGSSRVSVTIVLDTQSGARKSKLLLCPEDAASDVWDKLRTAFPTAAIDSLDEEFARRVLKSAGDAREDPEQLRELEEAVKRIRSGAAKSRDALLKRVRSKKETAFKKAARDLMDRGLAKSQLFQLIREAVIEEVHEK